MRKPILLSLAAICSAVSAFSAETASRFNTQYAGGDSLSVNLDNLDVTAIRTPTYLTDASVGRKWSEDDYIKSGITGTSDALRRLPGVNLRDYGGSGGMQTVSIRGFDQRHTGIMVDGLPVGDIRGTGVDLSELPIEEFESIELNIGDSYEMLMPPRNYLNASSVYLTTAERNFSTNKSPHIKFGVSGGSFGKYGTSLRSRWNACKSLSLTLSGNYEHSDNNYPFTIYNGTATERDRRKNSRSDSGFGRFGISWRPDTVSQLRISGSFHASDRRLPGAVVFYNPESDQHLKSRNANGQVYYRRVLSRRFELFALGSHSWEYTRYRDSDPKYENGLLSELYIINQGYGSAGISYKTNRLLTLAYSADFSADAMHGNGKGNPKPLRLQTMQNFSVRYTLPVLEMTARLLYIYSHDRKENENSDPTGPEGTGFSRVVGGQTLSKFQPYAGISLSPIPGEGWRVRAFYKETLRLPSFSELYFEHFGTLNLLPEKTRQFNIGMTWRRNFGAAVESVELTCDGYINNIHNKIVAIPYNMFLWTMTNLGKAKARGIDATARIVASLPNTQKMEISGNYGYMRVEGHTHPGMADWKKQLPYTPLNSLSGNIAWLNPWVNVSLTGMGCSSRYSTTSNMPGTRIPGYFECGMTMYRSFAIKGTDLGIRFDITNLLGKQYELVSRYPMPGRAFKVTAEWSIGS